MKQAGVFLNSMHCLEAEFLAVEKPAGGSKGCTNRIYGSGYCSFNSLRLHSNVAGFESRLCRVMLFVVFFSLQQIPGYYLAKTVFFRNISYLSYIIIFPYYSTLVPKTSVLPLPLIIPTLFCTQMSLLMKYATGPASRHVITDATRS